MTDPRILRLRVELYHAAQLLKGDDLREFTDLIREIAAMINIELTPAEIARITT
jgi:hypothetical protein